MVQSQLVQKKLKLLKLELDMDPQLVSKKLLLQLLQVLDIPLKQKSLKLGLDLEHQIEVMKMFMLLDQ